MTSNQKLPSYFPENSSFFCENVSIFIGTDMTELLQSKIKLYILNFIKMVVFNLQIANMYDCLKKHHCLLHITTAW